MSSSPVLRLGWHSSVGLGGRKRDGGPVWYAREIGIRLGVIVARFLLSGSW